jgi:hypothetical protein
LLVVVAENFFDLANFLGVGLGGALFCEFVNSGLIEKLPEVEHEEFFELGGRVVETFAADLGGWDVGFASGSGWSLPASAFG